MNRNRLSTTIAMRSVEEQTARLVQKAIEQNAPLLAVSLHRYAQEEGLTWNELAQSLECSDFALNAVALCRPPRAQAFVADVEAIAQGYVQADRLLPILRHIQTLEALRLATRASERSALSGESALLAAQDRDVDERGDI